MKIYGLSDPHLSLSIPDKTMEVFGDRWKDYIAKLENNWNEIVKDDNDIIIISGDISWCTKLSEAKKDFEFLNKLRGYKLISKGNHDYWFSTKRKVDNHFRKNYNKLLLIEKSYYLFKNRYVITGIKGFNPQVDPVIFERQLGKQYRSLENLFKTIRTIHKDEPIILSYHFPPIFDKNYKFHDLFKKYNVEICLYGHLHTNYDDIGTHDGIDYHLISADYLQFKPKLIKEI